MEQELLPPASIGEQTIPHDKAALSVEMPILTTSAPEEGDIMPTTQDSFMEEATGDNPIIDDNNECMLVTTDSRLDDSDVQFMLASALQCSSGLPVNLLKSQ